MSDVTPLRQDGLSIGWWKGTMRFYAHHPSAPPETKEIAQFTYDLLGLIDNPTEAHRWLDQRAHQALENTDDDQDRGHRHRASTA